MKKTRTILVDDEPAQREQLRQRLEKHFPEIDILSICSSAEEAVEAIGKLSPDLVFLDVEMPGMSGFEMLESLHDISFSVIFTTSHAGYAVRAFRVAAVDFLLKPFGDEDLKDAVNKYQQQQARNPAEHLQILMKNLQNKDDFKLALPTANGYIFVRKNDIIRLESQNTLTTFFLKDKNQIVVSRTLKECEEMLTESGFLRVHQSHMINLSYIRKFTRGEGGTVEMEDGSVVEISRRKKDEFLEALRRL